MIIPTQNRRERVRHALESVLSQEGVSVECIVVDDASWDGTVTMIKEDFPSVRVLPLSFPEGPAHARNVGLRHAQGEWIAFLDSDDAYLPGKLKKQLAFMKDQNLFLSQTLEIWLRQGKRVMPLKKHIPLGGNLFKQSLQQVVISCSSVMLHRKVLDRCGTFDEDFPVCEDYELWLRVTRCFPLGLLQEELVVKDGGRSDQLSAQYRLKDLYRVRALLKMLKQPLTQAEREAVREALRAKCRILRNGAYKRKRWSRWLAASVLPLLSE